MATWVTPTSWEIALAYFLLAWGVSFYVFLDRNSPPKKRKLAAILLVAAFCGAVLTSYLW
jgi:hypothetical protein